MNTGTKLNLEVKTMKKFVFLAIASSLILSTSVMATEVEKITWETAMRLPAQKGYKENIGTAGLLYGVLNGKYIVAAGGANFPIKPVVEGGPKVTYSDIYLLKEEDGKLQLVSQTNFPHEIAYGSSITTKDGIYYVGGAKDSDKNDDIWYLSMKDEKLDIKKVGELPFTFQNGQAVMNNDKIYIIAGKQDGKASNGFYEYDLKTNKCTKLADVPGETRTQEVAQILNGELYIFGGGNSKAFTDGYKYNFNTEKWTKVADVKVNGEEISVLGGNSIKLNENEMVVIGGFNKKVWDDANHYLSTLKGEELKNYKAKYFGTDPKDFNWNDQILLYNAKENSWKSLGEVPFDAPCGEGLILLDGKIISINGEIKPGVRTSRIYVGHIED